MIIDDVEEDNGVNIAVQNVSFAPLGLSSKPFYIGNGYSIKLPDQQTVQDVDITFLETNDRSFSALAYINEWLKKVVDPVTGVYNPPSEYKKESKLKFVGNIEGVEKGIVAEMGGMFPLSIGTIRTDYTQSRPVSFSVRFSCDNVNFNRP